MYVYSHTHLTCGTGHVRVSRGECDILRYSVCVCVCVCVCVYTYICVRTRTYVCVCMWHVYWYKGGGVSAR